MSGWFKPLHGKPKRREIIGFDIEGVGGPGGFVCGSIVGDYVHSFYMDRDLMFRDLLAYSLDGFWPFAHNLQYDLPILEGPAFPRGELTFTRYSLLWADYKQGRHKARLFDSTHLFPRHGVREMGRIVDHPKLDLDPWVLERLSKGYHLSDLAPHQREEVEKYVIRDAEIVLLAVSQLQELLLSEGGQLRATIAGCAMDLFRRVYLGRPWPVVGPKTNELVRPAYYGGRVENFQVGQVEGVNMYDVTSLYPAVQREIRYPHPRHLKLDVAPKTTHSWIDLEGVVSCSVDQPESFVPSLPFRYNKRLFFPTGEFTGMWTISELRRALEMGTRLKSVEFVLYSDVLFNPFREYIEKLFARRQWYFERGSGYANLVKLLLNSLYGRWGLNPVGGLYKLVDLDHVDDLSGFQGYETQDLHNKIVAYGQVEVSKYPDYVNVFLAAQVSAAGRAFLGDELTLQGEDLAYCDTDSIITRGLVPTSDGLGGWRAQLLDGDADLIGPKEYALHNLITGSKYIAKGVPSFVAEQYLKSGAARFMKAVGIREGLRNYLEPSTWVETFRSHQPAVMKRWPERLDLLQRGGSSLTRPYQVRELPAVVAGYYLPPDFVLDRRAPIARAVFSGEQLELPST